MKNLLPLMILLPVSVFIGINGEQLICKQPHTFNDVAPLLTAYMVICSNIHGGQLICEQPLTFDEPASLIVCTLVSLAVYL